MSNIESGEKMGRFKELLRQDKVLILHGALGTELEFQGHDVSGKLWSAKYLIENPQLIQDIHEAYLKAGSDIVKTSSYQATLPGLEEVGLTAEEAREIIRLTVTLAKDARDNIWAQLTEEEKASRSFPLISGDVGPYAAYLADGSEYTGQYGEISAEALKAFHRERLTLLLEEGSELLALETIPNLLEIQALLDLLAQEFPTVEAYLSVTTQDGQTLTDGSDIALVADLVNQSKQVLALGVNCSAPAHVSQFLVHLSQMTQKPLVTYPNSGEVYDGKTQTWTQQADHSHTLLENTEKWIDQGAQIVGGCCRTRPVDIAFLADHLKNS
ncbi:homocysteine S-methyltransferase [Streptococcus gallinaceus]|nr:homocysteine S-methyltransferase [Streptococcus gallinaceus]MCP1770114.1 homocysteine S-methyltransferase [Streptococcus gallinaceus]